MYKSSNNSENSKLQKVQIEINKYVQELGIREKEMYEMSSRENGAKIIFATDDYFGVAENLLKEEEPVQQEDSAKFGKRMDGWVTRNRHEEGHDFAIIELVTETKIEFICIDTAFFTNNFPIQFSIQGARGEAYMPHIQNRTDRLGQSATVSEMEHINQIHSEIWQELITKTNLEPGYPSSSKNFFARHCMSWPSLTHLRLNIFPSGGIARLRIYGRIVPHVYLQPNLTEFDLISRIHDGRCVSYSSKHSGHPNNLLKPGSPINADDGWETVKTVPNISHRTQKSIMELVRNNIEWAEFELGHIGKICSVAIDTSHFKGNAPSFVHVKARTCFSPKWMIIIPDTKVIEGVTQVISVAEDVQYPLVTAVKLILKPNGGINRFRTFGTCRYLESGRFCGK